MEFVLKKILIGLASVLALSAQAQSTTPAPASSSGLRGIVGIGFTVGGDQLGATITTIDSSGNSDSSKIKAGAIVDFRGGAEYQLQGQPLAIELSIGYHFDTVEADNGEVQFSRMPLELIGHYAVNEYWRVGGGLRKSLSAKLKASGAGNYYANNTKYTGSVGLVIEAEYFMTPQVSFKGRYVSETFKPEGGGKDVSGNHAGIYGMFYF
jgi:Outer membrane protein beta-barrel domain